MSIGDAIGVCCFSHLKCLLSNYHYNGESNCLHWEIRPRKNIAKIRQSHCGFSGDHRFHWSWLNVRASETRGHSFDDGFCLQSDRPAAQLCCNFRWNQREAAGYRVVPVSSFPGAVHGNPGYSSLRYPPIWEKKLLSANLKMLKAVLKLFQRDNHELIDILDLGDLRGDKL